MTNNAPAPLPIHFTDMAYGGDAVGRDPETGLTVFAWPGIEGERAIVNITRRRPNMLRGVVAEVLEPSPLRVAPPCPYFGPCGGCQWQHIEYTGQLQFKQNILLSQLARTGGIEDPAAILRAPIASPHPYGYRNTSHFAIAAQERSLGYFEHNSHKVIPVAECPISNTGVNAAIPVVRKVLEQAPGEEFIREQLRGVMWLWQVSIRSSESTGHTVVVFHTRRTPQPPRLRGGQRRASAKPDGGPAPEPVASASPALPLMRREVRRAFSNLYQGAAAREGAVTWVEAMQDGTLNAIGTSAEAAEVAAEAAMDALTGTSVQRGVIEQAGQHAGPPPFAWLESLGGRTYWVPPEAFFQVNTPAAEMLLAEVMSHVPAKLNLLIDAHAGVGAFAIALAARAKRALCFETHAAAIAGGRWTAATNKLTNIEFRQGRAEQLLAHLPAAERPNLVILDPPRAGCHPDLLAEILRRKPPRIVYVSCDPSTLARDIKALSAGYALESARVVDMFPQTYHIETVAVLNSK